MRDLGRRCVAEAVATFLLVFVGVGAAATDAATGGLGPVGVSLAFGAVVAAMVYSTGHISGAHLNPAVTVAFGFIGRFPVREIGPYVCAQVLGAVLASLLLDRTVGLVGGAGTTTPSIGLGGAWTVELVLTFSLMFVISAVATDDRTTPGSAGPAIGLAVAMGALAGGGLTGAAMNPARALGPSLAAGVWTAQWIYWTAPVVGALLGSAAYQGIRGRALPDAPVAISPGRRAT